MRFREGRHSNQEIVDQITSSTSREVPVNLIDGIGLNSRINELGNKLALEVLPAHHLVFAVDTKACPANL